MSQGFYENDTIVAIATPPGEGGIGVLRLSGPEAPKVAAQAWQGKQELSNFESHRFYFGKFIDPSDQEVLDEGLLVWMRAPRSYTGEEVLELHLHGGPLILNKCLQSFLQQGMRLAEPGEFTKRAYLNGKMDLLQAEAVGEMIHAQSQAALRNAWAQKEGKISQEVHSLRGEMLHLLARTEAAIDFSEEDIEILSPSELANQMAKIVQRLEKWLEKFQLGRLIREGIRVALVGRPNVGKSSLLNALLEENKAIVHAGPGTTRDVVEATVHWEGLQINLFDTAGIRQGEEEVERMGIERSKQTARQADLLLWVWDASVEKTAEDWELLQEIDGVLFSVGNKCDLGLYKEASVSKKLEELYPSLEKKGEALVSAKTGQGLELLKKTIVELSGLENLSGNSHAYFNNARHRHAIEESLVCMERAREALQKSLPLECLAADLRQASHSLGLLVGEIQTEEILGKIFSEFCIGK